MRKPINPVALAFWCVAAMFIVGDVPIALSIRDLAKMATSSGNPYGPHYVTAVTLVNIWAETRSALLGGGQLIGIGVLIELVDQIRWNALPPYKQLARTPLRAAIRRLRRLGVAGQSASSNPG